jgi:hypothetical protein
MKEHRLQLIQVMLHSFVSSLSLSLSLSPSISSTQDKPVQYSKSYYLKGNQNPLTVLGITKCTPNNENTNDHNSLTMAQCKRSKFDYKPFSLALFSHKMKYLSKALFGRKEGEVEIWKM